MSRSLSLRARLVIVILSPLMLIAVTFGAWAYLDAQDAAAARFDRSLLSTALAISRDTALTGGDLPSEETRDLLRDTSGGTVFYHAYAPDGVFVTGFATPPVPPLDIRSDATQAYYDATYRGAPVRALRFSQRMSMDGVSGLFTFTVWQQTSLRDKFVQRRTRPVFVIIASMIGALGLIVWFGVRLGLTPLIELEEAIARRSSTDLSPIRRHVPEEVRGIVARFNTLLGELSRTLHAKDAFISDATHQLRNPIAGVQTLAEAVQQARTMETVKERCADLLVAVREAGHLTNTLLTLEKARAVPAGVAFDPVHVLEKIAIKTAARCKARDITFAYDFPTRPVQIKGDPVMFEQAILNLLDNALVHGGRDMRRIDLTGQIVDDALRITVRDDGIGIPAEAFDRALERFGQIGTGAGSGLGLPIAAAVAETYGGRIALANEGGHLSVTLILPL